MGDKRAITALIAPRLRDTVTLFDGTQPLGVRFLSKHGHTPGNIGSSWAYWMRATDLDLAEPVTIMGQRMISEGPLFSKKPSNFAKSKLARFLNLTGHLPFVARLAVARLIVRTLACGCFLTP